MLGHMEVFFAIHCTVRCFYCFLFQGQSKGFPVFSNSNYCSGDFLLPGEKAINPGTILFREIRPGFKSLLQIGGQFITVHSGTNVIKTLKCTGLVGGLSLAFTNPFVRLR